MPFLRFSRDKRGYESTYLVHIQTRRGKTPRQRILYWYRTPPGVRVGRPPFDEEARRRLEAQNPDVTFDWPAIIATPMPPPPENEQWRERRRAERTAKQAQRADEEAAVRNDRETQAEPTAPSEPDDQTAAGDDTLEHRLSPANVSERVVAEPEPQPASSDALQTGMVSATSETSMPEPPVDRPQGPAGQKRRRRGGRRRGRRPAGPFSNSGEQPMASTEGANPVAPPTLDDGSSELSPDSEIGDFDSNEE